MNGRKPVPRRPKPVVTKRPTVTHGGKKIEIPLLSGPVGPSVPDLATKYRTWNARKDVEIVEYYFSLLAHINHLDTQCGLLEKPGPDLERSQSAVACWNSNLNQAIKNFQNMATLEIRNAEELKYGIIRPDGPTLVQLVDLGDCVEKLEALEHAKTNSKNYIYKGLIDATKFISQYKIDFGKDAHVNAKKDVNLRQFLGFLCHDPFMVDLRWMAYILATVFKETAHPDKKGGTWYTQWAPVDEYYPSKKKLYYSPVKVKDLGNDTARVTERDGDQWFVDANGRCKPLNPKTRPGLGANSASTPVSIYKNDDGIEHTYCGRGYAQLTWWCNYALTGAQIGKGISLLFEPEKALDPVTAYTILSYCLRTGNGFANHRKLSDYIYGSKCDFKGARHMVNGHDHAGEIEDIAKIFLVILDKAINSNKK